MFTIDDDNFYEQIAEDMEKEEKEWIQFIKEHPKEAGEALYIKQKNKESLQNFHDAMKLGTI